MVRKHDNFKAESWLEILVSCTKAPPTPPPHSAFPFCMCQFYMSYVVYSLGATALD